MSILNAARRISAMFPGYFQNAKHDHNKDFGYPDNIEFDACYRRYSRNGMAFAGVEKTILKTWQDNPELWENKDAKETYAESEIRQKFDDLRLWQKLAEADRRSMVGGYSGLILRYADDKRFLEPVDTVPGGLDGLVDVIPAWAGQLTVSSWDTDERSPTYGEPTMFGFNESAVGDNDDRQAKNRSFEVHPDRVLIWSKDGTIHNRSMLEPGFNNLIDMEKISGAGGEGFWKNAKSAPIMETDASISAADMAKGMGVGVDEIADKMNEQVEDFNKGFDAMLMLQGMKAKTLGVTLPQPAEFFNIPTQMFAASIGIPLKILVGSQSGERASTEDADEWSRTIMARRTNTARPTIMTLVKKLETVRVLPEQDWYIYWSDLTEASMGLKIERADKMAGINQKSMEEVYTFDEIRETTGHGPFDEIGDY
jgi:hypothetical protein